MKRRELIKSLALLGIALSVSKYQSLASLVTKNSSLNIVSLGHTANDMNNYFKECGLEMPELYIQNHEMITNFGWKISDMIADFEVLYSNTKRQLLIVSPSDDMIENLATGIINMYHKHHIEYHIIVFGPFPFEGRKQFDRVDTLIKNSYAAKSVKHIEMQDVIEHYGHLKLGIALESLYEDILLNIRQKIL